MTLVDTNPQSNNLKSQKIEPKIFQFDRVFCEEVQQEELFQEIKDVVGAVVDGKKVSIFAYGQTGAGKTYTMSGTKENPGLISRSVSLLFTTIDKYMTDGVLMEGTEVKISCIELYCDTIKDLLDPERGPECHVVNEGKRFKPLEVLVTCLQDVSSIMDTANKNRS